MRVAAVNPEPGDVPAELAQGGGRRRPALHRAIHRLDGRAELKSELARFPFILRLCFDCFDSVPWRVDMVGALLNSEL
jgi:hypothetical protein